MSSSTATAVPNAHDASRARRAVVAASLGNVLEWYDITLFAFMATTMTAVFYPGTGLAAQLMTWATFAVTFVVRPLGAVLIGHHADKHGRKAALSLTIGLMTLGVAIIVLLPGYSTLGIVSPIILIIARIIQGISAGGEFGSATAFMTENAKKDKAYYASWQVATQGVSMFMAAGVAWLVISALPTDDVLSWGWRLAFALGLLIGPIGWWIRSSMDDTPEFAESTPDEAPLRVLLRDYRGQLVTAFLCIAMATISVYLIIYLPSFSAKRLGLPGWSAYPGAVVAGVVTFIGSPLIGKLADRVGATTIMIPAAIAGIFAGWPLFLWLTGSPSITVLTICEVILGIFMCFYFAPLPSLLSEMFPVQVRSSGMTIAYSFGVALFGGFAPMILTQLLASTGENTIPGIYYAVICAISLVGVCLARFTFKER